MTIETALAAWAAVHGTLIAVAVARLVFRKVAGV